MEVTNNMIKTWGSLGSSKGRREHQMFLAQGTKCVEDTIGHFQLEALLATAEWVDEHPESQATIIPQRVIERISTLTTPPSVIAVYRIPDYHLPQNWEQHLTVALDCIQDPGNLGTIMRVCDWMGVHNIIASPDTADVWNPKVIQATMGAISRVKVHYLELKDVLADCALPVYGTFLDGENIYKTSLTTPSVLIMGNEGKGISSQIAKLVSHRLTIPPYPIGAETSESLNVAIATAITLSEFRRNG